MTDRFRPADRMADIAPFHVMEVMGRAQAAAAAGRDIVHMEVGEPDFSTAEPIVEAGIRALRDRHQLRLFMRRDPWGRSVSCLIYVPRGPRGIALRSRPCSHPQRPRRRQHHPPRHR